LRTLTILSLDESVEGTKEHASLEAAIREIIDQTKQSVEDMRKECEELELGAWECKYIYFYSRRMHMTPNILTMSA
jgi:hypothetical protein